MPRIVNVQFPDELHTRLKVEAALSGKTMRELVVMSVMHMLEEAEASRERQSKRQERKR